MPRQPKSTQSQETLTLGGRLSAIKTKIENLDRATMAGVWQIGKLLSEAKDLCQHGEFTVFVCNEFGWSMSYAARLMRIYKEYPNGAPDGVGVSTLLSTLSLDEQIRAAVNEIISRAELTKAEAEILVEKCKADQANLADLIARIQSPEEQARLKAELRAELEPAVRAEIKAEADPTRENITELETINVGLQDQLQSVKTALAAVEEKAAKAVQFETQNKEFNKQLIDTRTEMLNERAEWDRERARLVEEATRKRKASAVEIRPPADYESLKTELEQARTQLDRFRLAREEEFIKKADLLAENRRLRERVQKLESMLTEAGVSVAE